jgi:hypothetical protein
MKNYKLIAALVISALIALSCDFLMGPDGDAKSGNLSIAFGGAGNSGRAISSGADLPAEVLDALVYQVILTGPGGETLKPGLTAEENLTLSLALGEWRIDVSAYYQGGTLMEKGALTGLGSTTVTIKPGANSARIIMNMAGPLYKITISDALAGGTVASNFFYAFAGTPITLTVTPDEGYGLSAPPTLTPSSVTVSGGGTVYTFYMPLADVTVDAAFTNDFHNVTITTPTDGSVSASSSDSVVPGTLVTLTAVPEDGYTLEKISAVLTNTTTSVPLSGSNVVYTFTMPGADVTVNATFRNTAYSVGDTGPAGGKIFYENPSTTDGWRYLEADTTNLVNAQWGGYGTSVSETDTAIGTGQENTAAIVARLGELDGSSKAAQRCAASSKGGFNDWFLPSKDELNLMYSKKDSIGGFSINWYWSSSETDANNAWAQQFDTGPQSASRKDYGTLSVRAIRRF